ncbi:response regulator [Sphingobacterium sp. SRCM116780]|uniref:response regulator n=1 Tax=Sphingobacterium sp. SRCM116780 TaxID=2907623 RepID=UPI001F365A72|nr:response regulator [Sphingobacterium sp. SRCM116780]UIR54856.1 response regulator [Sphingobacterium sp. SRCM116780]
MFKKVLIAEDHEIANISVQKTLQDLGIQDTKYVYYCDHALTWIRNALRDGEPYDLLITDIEFEDDDSPQQIADGIELIKAIKVIQPDIKVIILTANDLSGTINQMFKTNEVDGFVRKARRDGQHLKEALHATYHNKRYQSPDLKKIFQEKNSHEFTSLDLHIVKMLYEGIPQKNMPDYLQQRDIKPSSLSSIEKRLNLMKEVQNFTNNEQLVAYCRENNLI